MIAIDTNIVVRVLTNDDARQAEKARALIERNRVFLPTTVLLETEWVLRTALGKSRIEIARALRDFLGLPTIVTQDSSVAATALDWAEYGMDFADALHLASSVHCESFASFDRDLTRIATKFGATKVMTP